MKKKLIEDQDGICPLCERSLKSMDMSNVIVDHDHESGRIRAALCRNCNGIEGKIKKQAIRCSSLEGYIYWLRRLSKYLDFHQLNPGNYLHPTHRTPEEKKKLKNKRARLAYKRNKGKIEN